VFGRRYYKKRGRVLFTRQCRIPSRGDRIVERRTGTARTGLVWYADQLQVLVKWDDGESSSLRVRDDHLFQIVEREGRGGDDSREHAELDTQKRSGHDAEPLPPGEASEDVRSGLAQSLVR
jgi:hypothetical protein